MDTIPEQKEVIVIRTSYTEAQKKATNKYRTTNKDKVNEQRKKYYKERKEKDPSFLDYKREKAKEYYAKKKAKSAPVEIQDKPKEEIKPEPLIITPPPTPKPEDLVPPPPPPKLKRQTAGLILDPEQKKASNAIRKLFKDGLIKEEERKAFHDKIVNCEPFELRTVDLKGKDKHLSFFGKCTPKPATILVLDSDTETKTDAEPEILLGCEEQLARDAPELLASCADILKEAKEIKKALRRATKEKAEGEKVKTPKPRKIAEPKPKATKSKKTKEDKTLVDLFINPVATIEAIKAEAK